MPVRHIAAAVVRRPDGKVLLLKRAPTHTTNPGKWCLVTGYVEQGELPRDAAIRELREELGIQSNPARSGGIVVVNTSRAVLNVHPFLFEVEDFPVVLDWEHTDFAWIAPSELVEYEYVPQLDEDLMALGVL